MIKQCRKYKILLFVLLLCSIITIYFMPKSLGNILKLNQFSLEQPIYCTFVDITSGGTGNISAADLGTLLPLFDAVTISGPVFYKNAVQNGDMINLYLAIPDGDGYKHVTLELIVENGYAVFLNIDNKGYWVINGSNKVVEFMNTVRLLIN